QLDSQLDSQLNSQLDSQLDAQLDSQLRSQLRSQLDSPLKCNYYVSYFWYSWAAYYDFASEIGVKFDTEKLAEFQDILLNAPLIAFVGNLIFVIEKPTILWDTTQRLGNDQKPAISWKDGTGLYFLDGISLQKEMWQQIVSQSMTFDEILKIQGADVRAVALKYNKNAIIDSGSRLIDEHPTAGELFLIKGEKINKILEEPELYFLRMKCPTGRMFVEAVEPAYAKQYPYALHCQAKAWGVPVEIYGQLRNEG
ncbi:MAG: hypothetical protein ACRD43_14495, partial [Pyrinomonadaceae bacterium]